MNVIRLTIALVTATALALPLAAQDTTAMEDTSAMGGMAPAAPASSVSVEAVLAHAVIDRMPQDSATAFPPDVGQISLWTRVTDGTGQAIHHVWFRGNEEVGDVELQIGGSPWRTWSTKTVPAEWTGPWHVEVRDAAGNVLATIAFTVG